MKSGFLSKFYLFSTTVAHQHPTNGPPNLDYELIHCNNPQTDEPEMKFRISRHFYQSAKLHNHFDATEVR